jgi:hypothetical protein
MILCSYSQAVDKYQDFICCWAGSPLGGGLFAAQKVLKPVQDCQLVCNHGKDHHRIRAMVAGSRHMS